MTEEVANHRIQLITQIIRQLLKIVPQYRGKKIGAETAIYGIASSGDNLLAAIPMPPENTQYEIRNTELEFRL